MQEPQRAVGVGDLSRKPILSGMGQGAEGCGYLFKSVLQQNSGLGSWPATDVIIQDIFNGWRSIRLSIAANRCPQEFPHSQNDLRLVIDIDIVRNSGK